MKHQSSEITRYAINGLIATFVHYSVLTANIAYLEFKSAGLANLIAAIFGIASSFLGSRYFVFKPTKEDICNQAFKFSSLYGVIAVLHGLFLWVWTDLQGLDYRIGFVIVTGMQVILTYLGNKFLVFKV
jgi:putative flippase GtrA